jgi:hypothetical protein
MKRLLWFALLLLLAITGCVRTVWVKPGATAEDFERDKAACRAETARAADPIFAAMYLGDCWRGRGWTPQRAE